MPLGLQERRRKTDPRRDGSSRAWTGEERRARNGEIFGTCTHAEPSNIRTERQSLRRREANGENWFGAVLRARAVRERLGFGTSRRKASARGAELPEALAWLPPALSWITRASPVRTQCYRTRAAPRCEPVATFEEKAAAAVMMLRRRRRWLPRKRDTHGRQAPASMTLIARERWGKRGKMFLVRARL